MRALYHYNVRVVVSGGFIAVGCLLYPLGWNNAEVIQACTALAHRYSGGQYTVVSPYHCRSIVIKLLQRLAMRVVSNRYVAVLEKLLYTVLRFIQ